MKSKMFADFILYVSYVENELMNKKTDLPHPRQLAKTPEFDSKPFFTPSFCV